MRRESKNYRGRRKGFFQHRKKSKNYDICPICNKPIHNTSTAIVHRETGKKAHFDCLLKELEKEYHLNPNEEIYYIGAGRFGIVEKVKKGKSFELVIKRRIQYEERD